MNKPVAHKTDLASTNDAGSAKTGKRRIFWLAQLYLWHRRLGILAALFLLLLSVTGILLNHSEKLGLDQNINTPWVMELYGLVPQNTPLTGNIDTTENGKIQYYWIDHLFYIADRDPYSLGGAFIGITADSLSGLILAVSDSEILLLTTKGALVERTVPGTDLGNIQRVGTNNTGQAFLQNNQGSIYSSDENLADWTLHAADINAIKWHQPEQAHGDMLEKAHFLFRGNGLPLNRVILDLHSGRLLGSAGPYLMDFAAIAMIFLSLTGVILWIKTKRRKNGKG